MNTIGFFTRSELKAKQPRIVNDSGLSDERLHELGLKGVKDMNPQARSRHIPPEGSDRPDVYILGEAPGPVEDEKGRHFVGPAGRMIRELIPKGANVRWNNCVRTLPIRRKGNLKPTRHEVECYRPSLVEDIARTKPRIVLALGDTATQWCLKNESVAISIMRGRRFPMEIGGHVCWVVSARHPFEIKRLVESDEYAQIPGTEHEKFFHQDVAAVFDVLRDLPAPRIARPNHLWDGIEHHPRSVDEIAGFLSELRKNADRATIDLETNRKRPYAKGAKILTIAVGNGNKTLAFPVEHPQSWFKEGDRNKIIQLFGQFLRSDLPKEGHNLGFDLEWVVWKWGPEVTYASPWHCTLAMAHILDERKGGKSVDFLMQLYFGIKLKTQSSGGLASTLFGKAVEEVGDIDRNRLEQTNVNDVLRYNGLDAKWQYWIGHQQRKLLKEQGLWKTYEQFKRRICPAVLSQYRGLPIDQDEVAKNQKELGEKLDQTVVEIKQSQPVRQFVKLHGEYKWSSVPNNVIIFRDILKRKEGQRGKKYSTDDEALSAMDDPLARLILKARGIGKLRGTYADRLMPNHPETLLFPDGRIHTLFKYTNTDTNRMASAEPNCQNFPKREDAWVRREVYPGEWLGEECLFLACDYGQQEYRGIAMLSGDKTMIESCFTDYDVHMYWAKRIIKAYPDTFERRHGKKDEAAALKAFRSEVKNELVFPAFYGSRMESCARSLEMPEAKLRPLFRDFWDMFKGVLDWQNELVRFYNKHGYVETASGFRRRGPLNKNQIINGPVQGTAGDMTGEAWYQVCRRAIRTKRLWLAPLLQIHDDLTFAVPKSKKDEALDEIVPIMCGLAKRFSWINVPLVVEVSEGPNWGDLKKYKEYRSDK